MSIKIDWELPGVEIEKRSFDIIEQEYRGKEFSEEEWPVVRRVIHSTADLEIGELFRFGNSPIAAILNALEDGCSIYSDSNMIKSGLSKVKLGKINPIYKNRETLCLVSDPRVVKLAEERRCSRSYASLELAKETIDDGIVLIGNAPLALAGIVRMVQNGEVKPRVIIGMPVGFVHVVESKEMLYSTDIPFISIKGRRGGSPLAVAAFHAVLEKPLRELEKLG